MKRLVLGGEGGPAVVDMTQGEVAEAQAVVGRMGTSALGAKVLLKTTIIGRCTDEELSAFDDWLSGMATLRQKMRWDNSVEISTADEEVRAVMTALFGEQRMLAILA